MKPLCCILFLLGLYALVKAQEECIEEGKCKAPNCRCMSEINPLNLPAAQVPQFVMLTYDDAINAINYDALYKEVFTSMTRKNPKGCNIGATFFASHEYNNYAHMHNLYRHGSEIAVHSITHESSTEIWKKASDKRWKDEAIGMRDMIVKYARIPAEKITGFRAPFLQTSGDTYFTMLHNLGNFYDSSMPTRDYTDPPVWPYTLDYGYVQDCVVDPCPEKKYPGQWIIPMISLWKQRVIDGVEVNTPCAMADGCLPYPETQKDTYDYLYNNFLRHYTSSRAPFPVFLHESWLKNPERRKGYIQFLDKILSHEGVFVVPVQEVLDYMKNPKTTSTYQQKNCVKTPVKTLCSTKAIVTDNDLNGKFCSYDNTILGGPRVLYICGTVCPKVYPWLNNIEGKKTF